MYKIDNKHSFNEFEKQVESLKQLTGPMYEIDNKHHYNTIMEKVQSLKDMNGPVFNIEQRNHCFSEIKKSLDSLKNLTG